MFNRHLELDDYKGMLSAAIAYGKIDKSTLAWQVNRNDRKDIYYYQNHVYFKDSKWESLSQTQKDLAELYLSILTSLDILKGEFPNSREKISILKEEVLDKYVGVERVEHNYEAYNHVLEIKPLEEDVLSSLKKFDIYLKGFVKKTSKSKSNHIIDVLGK